MRCETLPVDGDDGPAAATSASSSTSHYSRNRYACEPIFRPDWRVQATTRQAELRLPMRQELAPEEFLLRRRPPPAPPQSCRSEFTASPLRGSDVGKNFHAAEEKELLQQTLEFENLLRSRLRITEPSQPSRLLTVEPSQPSRASDGTDARPPAERPRSSAEQDTATPPENVSERAPSASRSEPPLSGGSTLTMLGAAAARAGRAASRGRTALTNFTTKERGKSPARQDAPTEVRLLHSALRPRPPEEVKPEDIPVEVSHDEASVRISNETAQLKRELERQIEQRKALQKSLASERAKSDALSRQNQELMQAAEERLKSQQRISCAETSELSDQVDALLMIKRQLYGRIQELEAERAVMINEREAVMSDRACVVCMDRVANTVLFRCKHLVCCEDCSARLTHCPVCRQPVRDRLPVFVL